MSSYAYPKAYRLLKPTQFKAVLNQTSFKVHQPHLMVFVSQSTTHHARLGMAITKKKLPTAVARNRLKRLIRERFRYRFADLPALDMVFTVKKPTKTLTNAQLVQQIDALLDKICQKNGNNKKAIIRGK